MTELPGGTVTFLFTDLSTDTTGDPGNCSEATQEGVRRHDALLRSAIAAHGGHIFQRSVGDRSFGTALCAAFGTTADALAAAIQGQHAGRAESSGEADPPCARMALHTGSAQPRDGAYVGPSVAHAAGLLAAGHSGQILLSQAAGDLARDALPAGASLRDLGEHRVEGAAHPERVFQLLVPGLPDQFPPLSVPETPAQRALPTPATPLIGRALEVAVTRDRLLRPDVRLLTLTGPGGTGKTRLALAVAAALADRFRDGVYFVPLASIGDPALVAPTIARVLGERDLGGRPVAERLADYVRDRHLLLVLDNFEHLLPAAPLVADLLAAGGGTKVLVTSRAVLGLYGEHDGPVPPLALPGPGRAPSLRDASESPAVALFVARATAATPTFALTDENVAAVVDICRRLDGLPLAIELAAARVRLLPPSALLARLDRRLSFLTAGPADLPARQRTLRGAIAWSHDLLSPDERRLFRRLGTFAGGATIDAAVAVCDAGGDVESDVLDGLASLVDKSLVRQDEGPSGEPRFGMLETVREYALEQLEASGELEATLRRHAEHFVDLSELAEPELLGRAQIEWLDRLEAEHDNLRQALSWSLAEPVRAETGARLAGALMWMWYFHGHVGEGRQWLDDVMSRLDAARLSSARARALYASGGLALIQGDYAATHAACAESMEIWRELGDRRGMGRSLVFVGIAAQLRGDLAGAHALLEEGAALVRSMGDTWAEGFAVCQLGVIARYRGDLDESFARGEQSLSLMRETGERYGVGVALASLGHVVFDRGEYDRAADLYRRALASFRELAERWWIARCLQRLAAARFRQGAAGDAVRLLGAAEALLDAIGGRLHPAEQAGYERSVAAVRGKVERDTFESGWAEGRAMSLEEAVAYALEAPSAA